ncbi:hypothetical protein [Aeromonas salmonicida]|uniref:hypothetical protein n=1 Tax=Aeromonas salmonicida TaxID=645 RepID=UPI001F4DE6F0|nr:hypothetical protein [Aeromonas salmonicida]
MVLVKPVIHGLGINPESERATVDQRPVVLRPIGDGVKRFTHDADLRGMVVLRSLGFQLVPFKLHRFRKQRPRNPMCQRAPYRGHRCHASFSMR